MGAGSGYTITVKNSAFEKMDKIYSDDMNLINGSKFVTLEVRCNILLTADIEANSYYYGREFNDVELNVGFVTLDLPFGNGYNKQILTDAAIEKFEEMYDADIESLWEEICENVELEDLYLPFIRDTISEASYDGTSEVIGAGWSHLTFDGEFTLEPDYAYGDVTYAVLYINNEQVKKAIDIAVTGDDEEDEEYL